MNIELKCYINSVFGEYIAYGSINMCRLSLIQQIRLG